MSKSFMAKALALAVGLSAVIFWSVSWVFAIYQPTAPDNVAITLGPATIAKQAVVLGHIDKVAFEIPFENKNKQSISVLQLATSCACAHVEPIPDEIPGGLSGTIRGAVRMSDVARDRQIVATIFLRHAVGNKTYATSARVRVPCRQPIVSNVQSLTPVGEHVKTAQFRIRQYRTGDVVFVEPSVSSTEEGLDASFVGDWSTPIEEEEFTFRERDVQVSTTRPSGGGRVIVRDRRVMTSLDVPVFWSAPRPFKLSHETVIIRKRHMDPVKVSISPSPGIQAFIKAVGDASDGFEMQFTNPPGDFRCTSFTVGPTATFPRLSTIYPLRIVVSASGKEYRETLSILLVSEPQT